MTKDALAEAFTAALSPLLPNDLIVVCSRDSNSNYSHLIRRLARSSNLAVIDLDFRATCGIQPSVAEIRHTIQVRYDDYDMETCAVIVHGFFDLHLSSRKLVADAISLKRPAYIIWMRDDLDSAAGFLIQPKL